MPGALQTHTNPDLRVIADNKARWNTPDHRRHGFHNLHNLNRYALMFRSDHVLTLTKEIDYRIGELAQVRNLMRHKMFSGMVVVRGQSVLHEAYAPDFGPNQPHSIMSVTKVFVNLMMGALVADGKIDLSGTVDYYIPEIGSGYAKAVIQDVLDMNIENDYSEDYADPFASSYGQEETIGWRLPPQGNHLPGQFEFLCAIKGDDLTNHCGRVNYKSANTDVLAWVVERASGKPVRQWMLEIVEAAGLEGAFYCGTDRNGFPTVNGGGCMTARDLARTGLLFARRGRGVAGRVVGDRGFIEHTRKRQYPKYAPPREWIGYSNHTFTDGVWLGHGGYGGQFMLADLDTGVVCVFYSVLENQSGYDVDYAAQIIRVLGDVAGKYG